MNEGAKLKNTITEAPLGAIVGAVVGYLVSRKVGYSKEISVVSFTMVGLILGSFIGSSIKSKKLA